MSKYTTEVRFLCESLTGHQDSVGFNDVDTVINDAIPIIFSFNFPIFDEEYRNVLCTKILRHYYTREIGSETYGLWKLRLQTKLNEIMPYYNKLYETELLKFDPLRDVDMQTTHVGTKTGTRTDVTNAEDNNERNASNIIGDTRNSEGEDTNVSSTTAQGGSTSTNRDLYSDTPQGALTGVENENYLTNARKITGVDSSSSASDSSGAGTYKNTSTGTREETITGNDNRKTSSVSAGKTNNTEDYVMHVFGKTAGVTYSKMLKEFRDNLLNIDMNVIRDLADLFMLIW